MIDLWTCGVTLRQQKGALPHLGPRQRLKPHVRAPLGTWGLGEEFATRVVAPRHPVT